MGRLTKLVYELHFNTKSKNLIDALEEELLNYKALTVYAELYDKDSKLIKYARDRFEKFSAFLKYVASNN